VGAVFVVGGARAILTGSSTPDIGLGEVAIGLGAVAFALGLQSEQRTTSLLNQIKSGEIDQKLAMIYTYVASLWESYEKSQSLKRERPSEKLVHEVHDAPHWDYVVERIVFDIRAVIDLQGEITPSMKNEIGAAEKSLIEQCTKLGLDTARIEGVFTALLYGSQLKRPKSILDSKPLTRVALPAAIIAFTIFLIWIGFQNFTTWEFDAGVLGGYAFVDILVRWLYKVRDKKAYLLGKIVSRPFAFVIFAIVILGTAEVAKVTELGTRIAESGEPHSSIVIVLSMGVCALLGLDFLKDFE
jgi:hypothetical protein